MKGIYMKKILAYYVYFENFNTKAIERYNVLSEPIIKDIKARTKNLTTKKAFGKEVDLILKYNFWSKSEYEIVLTDWPSHISLDELDRIQKELIHYENSYGHNPYSLIVNLRVAEKIDIYDQVKLNWEIFIDYLWNNLK